MGSEKTSEKTGEKSRLIAQMIAMQKRRLAGADSPDDETPDEFRGAFDEMATRVVDLAHKERGTSR